MRIVLRADAGEARGTGHVMRVLTLGEELVRRGHEAQLIGSLGGVGWLVERVSQSAVGHQDAAPDVLDGNRLVDLGADRVVVDSYHFDPVSIGALAVEVPLLAIVDGGTRGIDAGLYLDPNLGAERTVSPETAARTLAGSRYALVRREIVERRRQDTGALLHDPPRIVVFMGGTDATDAVVSVVAAVNRSVPGGVVIPVTTAGIAGAIAPTTGLPELLADADVVVCAAGTSAWDVCTMAVPAVLIAVVENQRAGFDAALAAGVAGGVDASDDPGALERVGEQVALVLDDEGLRASRVARARELFDGRGAARVAAAVEQMSG